MIPDSLGTDQHRRRRTILGNGYLILRLRDSIDVFVELVLHLGDRKNPHATMIGANTGPH